MATATSNGTIQSPWKDTEDGKRRDFVAVRQLPYEAKLRELFGSVSGVAALAGDPFTQQLLENRSEELAYAWSRLAKENDHVKRIIAMITEGSVWGETIALTMSVALPIMWRYGFVPDAVGAPLAMASGVMPVSREQEQEQHRRAQQESPEPVAPDANNNGSDGKDRTGSEQESPGAAS